MMLTALPIKAFTAPAPVEDSLDVSSDTPNPCMVLIAPDAGRIKFQLVRTVALLQTLQTSQSGEQSTSHGKMAVAANICALRTCST